MVKEVSESCVESLLAEIVLLYCSGFYANKPELAARRIEAVGFQRWGILKKKKQGNTKAGTSSQPPETQLLADAHRAMSLALNMPMGDKLKSAAAHMAAGCKLQRYARLFGRLWWDETVPTVVTRAEPRIQMQKNDV